MHAATMHQSAARFQPMPFRQPVSYRLKMSAETGPDGFIHHPSDFPIQARRLWFESLRRERGHAGSRLGLSYTSEKFIRPGTFVELQIPLRGETQKFRGEIVLVRDTGFGYEIGVWLETDADAARARIVEQICHIESYLNQKRSQEGRPISRQGAAQEWITKFAASFPVF